MSQQSKKMRIECLDTVKIYEGKAVNTIALRGITCNFESGKIYTILGPSGSGKTTLLNLLSGLLTISSGEIQVDSQKFSEFSQEDRERFRFEHISYILQEPRFISYLNVQENVQFGFELKKHQFSEGDIDSILEYTNLTHKKKAYTLELSGGEKQRLSIAIALAIGNQIFLCDEPTGELDTENKVKIAQLLKKVAQDNPRIIMIIVTHDPLFIQYSDQIMVIEDGIIKQNLTISEYNQLEKIQVIGNERSLKFNLKKKDILTKIENLKSELSDL